jgi:16S rRNA (cytosine1402-N4)-methyltransferase
MKDMFHIPIMTQEILAHLQLSSGKAIVDGTMGTGGHSIEIARCIAPNGRLIGIDRDEESLAICRKRLQEFEGLCEFVHANFIQIDEVLKKLKIDAVDGILLDLGISSFQLLDPQRGFSFQSEGPLDMRLDRGSYISAYDLLNNLNEDEISALLKNFGQERWHNRIAHHVVLERRKQPIATTSQLANIVVRSMPSKYRHVHHRIHPATRTFQAVRIAVNRELETLQESLQKAISVLKPGARICVISFHSLEDRIVKHTFRASAQQGVVKIITKKPLVPTLSEVQANPSSRSGKLRVAQKL